MISFNSIIILTGVFGIFFACYYFLKLNTKKEKESTGGTEFGFVIYLFSLWLVFYMGWLHSPWTGIVIMGTIILHGILLHRYMK